MLVKKVPDIKSSEITGKKLYLNRRQFIVGSAALATWRLLSPTLLQESGSSSLEPGKGTPYRRGGQAQDPDVQRLC